MDLDALSRFLLLSDPNTRYVVLGSLLLTGSSALVGCFTLLRKRALVGDAVAHAVLPGVCLAFVLQGSKHPAVLLAGAFATGWAGLRTIDWLAARTKLKEDTAIGLVLSVFFGVGILLLTAIQQSGNAAQSGLDKFLFGNAAALTGAELWTFGVVALLLVLAVVLLRKEFALMSFDADFAQAAGLPVRALELVLATLNVLAVVVGIQAVGVVLMAAMLVTPAVAARQWTNRMGTLLVLAAGFGMVSGWGGALVSYLSPGMPTGPWMVLIASALAGASLLAAPGRGVLARWWRQRVARRQMLHENILKTLYQLGEAQAAGGSGHDPSAIRGRHRALQALPRLRGGLRRLHRRGLIRPAGAGWTLTPAGRDAGQAVVRRHRLWEAYLAQQLRLPPDHVHDDAETVEHLLTPELEQQLAALLDHPTHDPHDEHIPYRQG